MLHLSETCWFLQSLLFWEARQLWLASYPVAEYLKRETEMLRLLPYCDAMFWRGETKPINETSVKLAPHPTQNVAKIVSIVCAPFVL